jgi:hypothetical protein
MHHIAFAHHVVAAFEAHLAGFLGALFAVVGDEVVIGNGLGADEAFFEVAVYDAGGLGRRPAFLDGPGAGFFRADSEVRLQTEQIVSRVDQLDESGLLQADGFEEFGLLFVGQCGDLGFELGADDDARRAFLLGALLDAMRVRIAAGGVVLVHVADVEYGQRRQELQHLESLLLFRRALR